MVKDIKHYQVNRPKSLKDQQVSVKSFPSATIRSMKHYIQPTLEENLPDKILLHVGTKDLSSAKNAYEIASVMEPVDICIRSKIHIIVLLTNIIIVIVSCGDYLNIKGKAMNKCLKEMCKPIKCMVLGTHEYNSWYTP